MVGPLALVFACVAIGTVAELLMKVGMGQVGPIGRKELSRPAHTFLRVLTKPLILAAGLLYALGLLLWLAALSRLDLSLAMPVLGSTYATVPLAARLFLKEPVSRFRWLGIALIFAGVVLVARS